MVGDWKVGENLWSGGESIQNFTSPDKVTIFTDSKKIGNICNGFKKKEKKKKREANDVNAKRHKTKTEINQN